MKVLAPSNPKLYTFLTTEFSELKTEFSRVSLLNRIIPIILNNPNKPGMRDEE
jgi:hypothetical protein